MLTIIMTALNDLIWIINTLILIRVLLSWFPGALESKIGALLLMLTEPILSPIRKLLMKFEFARSVPVDFSPIVAWLLLILIQRLLQVIYVLLV